MGKFVVEIRKHGEKYGAIFGPFISYAHAEIEAEAHRKDKLFASVIELMSPRTGKVAANVERFGGTAGDDFAHSPENCPSNHWNRGDDICGDCGENLQ